jgi:hypothetical protein
MSKARWALVAVLASGSCRPGSGKPVHRDDARSAPADAASVSLSPQPLGATSLTEFAYRSRDAQTVVRQAREAEQQGQWAEVAKLCEAALATDSTHLDAAYLLAVARAKQQQFERVIEPLSKAVTGDFAKWGNASLAQPALQPFLATTLGQAYRARVEADRDVFAQMFARALIVTSHGDLFGFDPETSRFLRLTRTGGAVIGALAMKPGIAYITREKVGKETKLGVGLLDLGTGKTHRAAHVAKSSLRVAFNTKLDRFIVRQGNDWYRVVDKAAAQLELVPRKDHPGYPARLAEQTWLDVRGNNVTREKLQRIVSGDWDEIGLASAMRITSTHKIVTVPSPGLINGNTVERSPDGSQLVFVAQLSDTCKPGDATAAAFVADTATGTARELERATAGVAAMWMGDRTIAIAGDHGVSIVDLDTTTTTPLIDADGLLAPRFKPKCVPDIIEEPVVSGEDTAD